MTPTCTPWVCRRRATLQRGLQCCTPHHAAPLTTLHPLPCYLPLTTLHPLPCCTLHALTALHPLPGCPPLARRASSLTLTRPASSCPRSCTTRTSRAPSTGSPWPPRRARAAGCTRWASSRWTRPACSLYLPTSPYISLCLPISLHLTRWASSRWDRSTCSSCASRPSPSSSARSRRDR